MPACPNYTEPAADNQQLSPWTPTSPYDCSAGAGSWLAGEDTCGAVDLTVRQVRLNSTEPVPCTSPGCSPGLNLAQVDAAVYKASGQRVNLQRGNGTSSSVEASLAYVQRQLDAGRSVAWQFVRGRLSGRVPGLFTANGFTGLHAGGLKLHPFDSLRMFDPLVRIYLPIGWDDVRYAAIDADARAGTGIMNVLVSRDRVPSDYYVRIDAGQRFSRYKVVNDRIVDIRSDILADPVVRRCSRLDSIYYPAFSSYRNVVRLHNSADPEFPYVRADRDPVHYHEVLP
jgi:hypothetical protein